MKTYTKLSTVSVFKIITLFKCFKQMLQPIVMLTLDKEVVQLFWMMCSALERRTDLWTVPTTGIHWTAHTLKMLVFAAKSLVSANLTNDIFPVGK